MRRRVGLASIAAPASRAMRVLLALGVLVAATAAAAQDARRCGEVVTLPTHEGTTTRYAFAPPSGTVGPPLTLVLLAGGSGHLDLDDQGCPRALRGNSLVRSIPLFGAAGFGTALVDAPSDHVGADGLGGFRIDARHAEDLGRLVVELRARTQGAVWLIGTSRGTISAVNAAARLSGPAAPDGVVLTSPVSSGQRAGRVAWATQTVFDLPLGQIRLPVLLVGHAADACLRSPPDQLDRIAGSTGSVRRQVVIVTGGPGRVGPPSLADCEGRSPHGFVDQEKAVVEGIARFVRGGSY